MTNIPSALRSQIQPSAVLFACNMNAVRSPMAEAFLKRLHGSSIFVDSCGVQLGEVDGFAIEVMAEIGIDISHHRPKSFDQMEDDFFDLIISFSPEAQHRSIEMTRTMACDIEYWPTFDATMVEGSREVKLDAYRQVREQIEKRILEAFPLTPVSAG